MAIHTITIEVSDKELDALEDLCTVELSEQEEAEARRKALAIWQRMVDQIQPSEQN